MPSQRRADLARAAGRLIAFALVWASALLTLAPPAAAHGESEGEPAPATNYRTRILRTEPRVEGITVRVIEAGSRLELRNTTDREVMILGYENEPYLRVGPDGVFENVRSKSPYINASRDGDGEVPAEADANAEPRWEKESDTPRARWHDHRAHWMGQQDPPHVRRAPGREHVIVPRWELVVMDGDRRILVTGDLTWVPAPSPFPWLAAAAGAAAITIALALLRGLWRVVLPTAAGLVAAAGVLNLGAASVAGTTSTAMAFGPLIPLLPIAGAVMTVVLVIRARTPDGFVTAAAAGALSVLVFGLTSLDFLSRSQLPVAIDPALGRAGVVVSLGVGLGLFVAGLVRWRLPAFAVAPAETSVE